MRKILLLLSLICALYKPVNAAVGDTTWVQAHNNVWLTYNGDYDTAAGFPDGTVSYRKIYMIVTMGKYACPGNPQYCADWDYTVHHYLMTKTGDTLELGRLITPYANSSYIRFPATWQQRYTYDVTDYYKLLKDSVRIRVGYSGYSGGFTSNIKFAMVEGTRTRDVLGIDRLWHGYFAFGKVSDPIETHVASLSKTAPANTVAADLKMNITGHGSDGTYCSEFCKKYYKVMLNGSQVAQKDIWRDNCGYNHLYPQSGTWVYNRANWCPGDQVYPFTHTLGGVAASASYNVDVDFETYSDNGSAGYDVEGQVIYHGAFNHTTDADLLDIISPSGHEMHFRDNPTINKPTVQVRNTGSSPITSMKFEYTINGGAPLEYTWTGTLAPLADTIIIFPEEFYLRVTGGTGNVFAIKIATVNGAADQDASNNALSSTFTAAPAWPMTLVVTMATNKAQAGSGFSDNNWRVVDALGNTIAERKDNAISHTYIDTVKLGPGSYQFIVEDNNCDGINFWANNPPTNPNGPGPGAISVKSTASIIPLPMSGYFNGDFGCGFTQAFNVSWPTTVQNINNNESGMSVYPNPASNTVNVVFAGLNRVKGMVKIFDALGRVVLQQNCDAYNVQLNTSVLSNGVYNLMYIGDGGSEKLQSRLVISK